MASGSWEIAEQNKVMCAILHTEVTTLAWAFGLRNLMIPGPIVPLAGMPYDHARNEAVRIFLGNGLFQYLFFLDSDVVAPPDTIYRLLAHNQPIVSGMYCRRSPPHGLPVAIKNGSWVTNFVPGSVLDVDLVGAGCLLIHRSVLEKVPPQHPCHPWFWWKVDMASQVPQGEGVSEDFSWCQHVRKHGYKVLLDTGVRCRHVGYAEAELGSLNPLNTVPVT